MARTTPSEDESIRRVPLTGTILLISVSSEKIQRVGKKAIYGVPETCGYRGGPGSPGPGPQQSPDLLPIPLCPIPPGGRWDRDGRDSPGLQGKVCSARQNYCKGDVGRRIRPGSAEPVPVSGYRAGTALCRRPRAHPAPAASLAPALGPAAGEEEEGESG